MFRSKRGSADSRANAQYTRTRRRKRIREEERQRRRDQQQRREERERQEEITGATAAERFAQRQRAFAQRHAGEIIFTQYHGNLCHQCRKR